MRPHILTAAETQTLAGGAPGERPGNWAASRWLRWAPAPPHPFWQQEGHTSAGRLSPPAGTGDEGPEPTASWPLGIPPLLPGHPDSGQRDPGRAGRGLPPRRPQWGPPASVVVPATRTPLGSPAPFPSGLLSQFTSAHRSPAPPLLGRPPGSQTPHPPSISPQAQHSPQGAWGHRQCWETVQPPAPRPGWPDEGGAYM